MFKLSTKLIFVFICVILSISASRSCDCLGVSNENTKYCCNRYNGNFRNYGILGTCDNLNSGDQSGWKLCCKNLRVGYNCWDI